MEFVDEGHRDQQNTEHLPPTLDNKVFDIKIIVENAVSHASLRFPTSLKSQYNICVGPAFARSSQGFEVGARTNASYEGRHRRTPT